MEGDNPHDNARMESFLKMRKGEEVYLWEHKTPADVSNHRGAGESILKLIG